MQFTCIKIVTLKKLDWQIWCVHMYLISYSVVLCHKVIGIPLPSSDLAARLFKEFNILVKR